MRLRLRDISYAIPVVLVALLIFWPAATQAKTLRFTAIDYCPFTCDPKKENGKEGFMTDVLRAAFEEAGYLVEIKMFPYVRAVAAVTTGEYDGIAVVAKPTAPELIYTDTPTEVQPTAFFVRNGSAWRYRGTESLKDVVIGTVKGYDYSDSELNRYFEERGKSDRVIVLHGVNTTERGLRMLLTGRIDTYIEGEYSAIYQLNRLGLGDQVAIAGYSTDNFEDFTGFNPRNPKSAEYARLLSDKIRQMRRSGEMQDILGRYGIEANLVDTP